MLSVLGLVALVLATSAMAADNAKDHLQAGVKTCVGVVRSQGYTWFDADANRAPEVNTNIVSINQQAALFPFGKCTEALGFPIGDPHR